MEALPHLFQEVYLYDYAIKSIKIPALNHIHQDKELFIEFIYDVFHNLENKHLDGRTTRMPRYSDIADKKIELRRFERSKLTNRSQTFRFMSGVLPMFGIRKCSRLYSIIVDAIVAYSTGQISALSVHILKKYTKVHDENQCPRCFRDVELNSIEMAMRVSESERMKKLIVPASESSIKKLLKKVRVTECDEENGEEQGQERERKRRRKEDYSGCGNCTICLEEFSLGSYATQMPCKHQFHKDCIVQWLRVNHYCPLCRFKMPTHDQLD